MSGDIGKEKLILDTTMNRYQLILLVLRWAKELEKSASGGKISLDELVNQALNDILSGKVKPEEIMKLSEGKKFTKDGSAGKEKELEK